MKTKRVEILVEEPSMEICLQNLLPRLIGTDIKFQIHPFQGKKALFDNLSNRLRGYAKWLPSDYRIFILLDRDDQDCHKLKETLELNVKKAGLISRSNEPRIWQVVNRIVIEELEAWYFGDMEAVRKAYPRVPAKVENKAEYRDPDAIRGGTWEALERVLKKAGYFKSGLRKIEVARSISPHLDPERNISHSFQVFKNTLLEIGNLP